MLLCRMHGKAESVFQVGKEGPSESHWASLDIRPSRLSSSMNAQSRQTLRTQVIKVLVIKGLLILKYSSGRYVELMRTMKSQSLWPSWLFKVV